MVSNGSFGQYQIGRKLGEGGFSAVYQAYDSSLGQQVALKLVHPHVVFSSKGRERFRREVEAARRLRYKHIVPVYNAGFVHDRAFISMRLMDRDTLAALLQVYPMLDPRYTAQIMRYVGLGLDHARRLEVMHRDVKPSNIFLESSGNVCLGDFGIAKVRGFATITRATDVVGSVYYMSPEQISGLRNMSYSSDIYSLGVVLYELVTGCLPFTHEHKAALLHAIINQPPPRARSVNPNVSPAVENVLIKALEKKPGRRYRSGTELAAAYEKALTGSRSLFPASSFQAGAGTTQRPLFWILVLGLLAIVLLFLFNS